ncbi:MAG TPA: hypothetical protein DEP53_13750, partial [Bacteroidetes bacterium]|nr:hypothetical protein [Bacteroidota bacterium]
MRFRIARRSLLILAFFIAWAGWVFAQTSSIHGVVTDSLTRQRIPSANVSILNTARGSSTNTVGFYLIPKLPPGSYELEASVMGYIKVTKRVTVR